MSLMDLKGQPENNPFNGSWHKPATNTLRIKHYGVAGSGYARRIKEEEWEQFRDAIDELEAEGCSRRDILKALHANYAFFPTYGQLNARMNLWQHSPKRKKSPQVPSPILENNTDNSASRTVVNDIASKPLMPTDWSFVVSPVSGSLSNTTLTLKLNENQVEDATEIDTTTFVPLRSTQQQEPTELSEADVMSISSSGSSDFRHFSRYAATLRNESVAVCYKSRASRSSSSSHRSWSFEAVTGLPQPDTILPFYRIRSGAVLGAKPTSAEMHSPRNPRNPRTVVVHQPSGASYDTPRTSEMSVGRWR